MKHGKKSQIQKVQISAKSAKSVIEIKKTPPLALVEQSITQTKRQRRTILQNIEENQSRVTPNPVAKSLSRIQILAKKNKKEDWEKLPALSTAIHL